MFTFMFTHGPEILQKVLQHITLSLSAVLLACLIGIPLGFFIVGKKRASSIVLGIANIIQTIPSLAMFAFALPLFGIGVKPAIFALFLYALLPILKNTLLGIRSVDPAIKRAAKGMGMSKTQIMFMVEVPLSISIIMGGVRIATVTSIGVTTIATLIAAGGLGDFIYQGLSTFNQPMILTGALLSALLALIADFFLGLLEKKLTSKGLQAGTAAVKQGPKKTKHTKRNIIIIAIAFVALTGGLISQNTTKKDTIRIINKNFTEQRLLGQVLGQYLENEGYDVQVKELGGTMLCLNAMEEGEADIYSAYTGTVYADMLNLKEILGEQETYDICKDLCEKNYGITWLEPYGFNNTYSLCVLPETAEKYNLKTISDLAPYASEWTLGGDPEFGVRKLDGLPALEKKYGFEFKDYRSMDQGLTYVSLVNKEFEVNSSFSTDGRILKYDLVELADDKHSMPPYFCTPIMKQTFADSHPGVVKALNKMKGVLSDRDMQKYNLMIDEGEDVKAVATKLLKDKHLI